MNTMTLYRAADSPTIREGDCLTDDLSVAREYARQRGYAAVYACVVSEAGDWADGRDLDRVASTLHGDDRAFAGAYEGAGHACADADQWDVRDALRAERNVAVQYGEPWGHEHETAWTLRLLDPTIVIAVSEVPS